MCVCSLYPLVEHPQRKLTSVGFTQSMYYTTTRQGGYYTKFDTGVCRTDNMGGQSPDHDHKSLFPFLSCHHAKVQTNENN